MYKKISLSAVIAAVLLSGCSDDNKAADKEKTNLNAPVSKNLYGTSSLTQNNQSSSNTQNTRDVKAGTNHIATVLETMNAANYTYAKVKENGNVYWVAGPESKISVGAKISFVEQMVMEQFTSKSLGKTFDSIVFASLLIPVDKSAVPKDNTHASSGSYSPHSATKKQVVNTGDIRVAKANGGYSVEELHTKKAELKDKKIKVNAKVVKVSKNIMKKDWIHLQDGTGAGQTSDIVVTTVNSNVKVGDTVSVDAKLETDVDFGYGYFFGVILQEGKLKSLN